MRALLAILLVAGPALADEPRPRPRPMTCAVAIENGNALANRVYREAGVPPYLGGDQTEEQIDTLLAADAEGDIYARGAISLFTRAGDAGCFGDMK